MTGRWIRTDRGRCRSAARQGFALILLGAMAWLAVPAGAGRLLPLNGPYEAVYLTAAGARLVRVTAGKPEYHDLGRPLDCLTDGLGFSGREAFALTPTGELAPRPPAPEMVRECLRLADGRYLLLLGGSGVGEGRRETRTGLYDTQRGFLGYCAAVLPQWHTFALFVAAPGATWQQVLVSVRKTAPFDPVFRPRPWLYEYVCGARDLVPLWKGTSLARPYEAAVLANILGERQPQLCAVENLPTGRRLLTAYRFTGRMQLAAQSLPLPLGRQLATLPVEGKPMLLVVCRSSNRKHRYEAFAAVNEGKPETTPRLLPTLRTADTKGQPLAWAAIRGAAGAGVLELTGSGLVYLPLATP